MMKNRIFLLLFLLLSLGAKGQDISNYFTSIPDSIIPHLETEWRKDLVDLYINGKEAKLQNMIGGISSIEKLTTDYLLLKPSEKSSIEMKLLPLVNNTHVICLITTAEGPVRDSRVDFYTTDWNRLDAADLYTPVTREWFLREDMAPTDEQLFLLSRLDMDLIWYSLSPDDTSLTAQYMTPLYLAASEREQLAPFLKEEPKKYLWNKSYFK